MGSTMRVGLVGFGYWGPNLARCISQTDGCSIAAICDSDPERLRVTLDCYSQTQVTTRYQDLLDDPAIDAIVIATPAALHYRFALAALRENKHVLVEKPMAQSVAEAEHLEREASQRGLTLLVDHTFLFSPAVRKLRQIVANGELGELRYFDSTRANHGLLRDDVNVFWDVAVHDMTIVRHVLQEEPVALSAVGIKNGQGERESMGHLTLFFGSGAVAHITASWLSPWKVRQMVIGGDEGTVRYDDMEPDAQLRLYGNRPEGSPLPEPRVAPVEKTEPLQLLAQHFRDCVQGIAQPLCGGTAGRQVIELLSAVDRSVAAGGSRIAV